MKDRMELSKHDQTVIGVEDLNQHIGKNWLRGSCCNAAAGLFITIWATVASRGLTYSYTIDVSLLVGEVVYWTGVVLTSVNVYLFIRKAAQHPR